MSDCVTFNFRICCGRLEFFIVQKCMFLKAPLRALHILKKLIEHIGCMCSSLNARYIVLGDMDSEFLFSG